MKLVKLATALIASSLFISFPVFAEDEHTASAPEAKHEVDKKADHKAKSTHPKKEKKHKKEAHKDKDKDNHDEHKDAAKHEGTEGK